MKWMILRFGQLGAKTAPLLALVPSLLLCRVAPAADVAPCQPPQIVRFQYPLTNGAYGYPRGELRRLKPFVLMCIHITGNRRTSTMPDGIRHGSGDWAEAAYVARNRHWDSAKPDKGCSAHSYISRDGGVLDCIPTRFAAWNNGEIDKPNTALESIRRIIELRSKGTNPNEAYVREVECTGFHPGFPLTEQQRETVAYLVARDSLEWNMPISRETVHLHADLDSGSRARCPFVGDREKQVTAVIARAQEIRALLPQTQAKAAQPQ
jgi:hypothetical protein